jgi:hypothetical protein
MKITEYILHVYYDEEVDKIKHWKDESNFHNDKDRAVNHTQNMITGYKGTRCHFRLIKRETEETEIINEFGESKIPEGGKIQ